MSLINCSKSPYKGGNVANTAMKLTLDNLEFIERFDAEAIRRNVPWWKALLEHEDAHEGEQLYIILAYRFEDQKFVRESVTVMDSENFHRRFVFVEEDKAGFSQVLLRDYVEE